MSTFTTGHLILFAVIIAAGLAFVALGTSQPEFQAGATFGTLEN